MVSEDWKCVIKIQTIMTKMAFTRKKTVLYHMTEITLRKD